MEPQPTPSVQDLVLGCLAEMGAPGMPLSLSEAADRSGGVLSFAFLRALARGERNILTAAEAAALAAALDISLHEIEMATTVLPEV